MFILNKSNVRTLTYLQFHVGKVIEIRGVVDGTHLDRNRGRSFPDVFPVDATEERCQFKLFDAPLSA